MTVQWGEQPPKGSSTCRQQWMSAQVGCQLGTKRGGSTHLEFPRSVGPSSLDGVCEHLTSECRRRGKNERKLNTRGWDARRLTMPPAKPTERREGDEAHVHTDRAN